jgi:hypothetical protein
VLIERSKQRVDGIRFGENAHAFAEAAHAARVDHDNGEAGLGELEDELSLVASGRLDHDALGIERGQATDELGNGPGLVAGVLDASFGPHAPLQSVLGDIDPDAHGHGKLSRATNSGSRIRARASGPGDRSSFAAAVEQ